MNERERERDNEREREGRIDMEENIQDHENYRLKEIGTYQRGRNMRNSLKYKFAIKYKLAPKCANEQKTNETYQQSTEERQRLIS